MKKRASDAKDPNRKHIAAHRAWNTLDGLINVSSHAWSVEVDSALAPVWKHRLRWYETLLLLANRMEREYPGIRDVFLGTLIPRFIKPRLLLNARFFSGALQQCYSRLKTPPAYTKLADMLPEPIPDILRAIVLADLAAFDTEMETKRQATIRHFVRGILASVETWTDDPDPLGGWAPSVHPEKSQK